jgi:hypothetical protein
MSVLGAELGLIVVVAFAGAFFVAGAWRTLRPGRVIRWREAAERFGLTGASRFDMSGVCDGFEVRAKLSHPDGRTLAVFKDVHGQLGGSSVAAGATTITIQGVGTRELDLAAEGVVSRMAGGDVSTGDTKFDRKVVVKGPLELVSTLLDEVARAALLERICEGWALEEGVWKYRSSKTLGAEIERVIADGLECARTVRTGMRVLPERLVAAVVGAATPELRRASLDRLVRHFRDHVDVARALAVAAGDSDAGVRWVAGRALGDAELLYLLATDEQVSTEIRVGAFEAGVSILPGHETAKRLVTEWGGRVDARRGPFVRAALLACLTVVPDAAEELLMAAVGDVDDEVALAAVRGLGAVGSVAAVPLLTTRRDGVFGSAVGRAAQEAILAIQARASGAQAGALALAGDGGGLALSGRDSR